jgi:addiction module RelE/StbE family toxin
MQIEFSNHSLDDLSDIKNFIKKDSEYYANEFIDKIFDAVFTLSDFPEIGRIVPEFNMPDVRELIFKNYRIVYKIKDNLIYIVSVMHGSRNLKKHINESDII